MSNNLSRFLVRNSRCLYRGVNGWSESIKKADKYMTRSSAQAAADRHTATYGEACEVTEIWIVPT